MKKATNSNNRGKISKLFPIMQEHFGQSMNLARIKLSIKLMALLLEALVRAQTVSLVRLANAMDTAADRESNMRRLQRFLAGYVLDLDLIARIVFSLLPVRSGLVLTMDRTNWKYGQTDINVLLLGVAYKNVAFPLLYRLLPKRGNSNTAERVEIIERFIRLFGKDCIDCLVADRDAETLPEDSRLQPRGHASDPPGKNRAVAGRGVYRRRVGLSRGRPP